MMPGKDPFIGMTLGSYEILEAIGEGGMARIYKGFHTELNRYAAIKVVNWGLQEDPEFTQRFRREAQAIASLRHPNIVQIFDFGKHESGYFMVMEFIDGSDLAVLIRQAIAGQSLLPPPQVVRVIKEVSAALDYAHRRDVIHRDVKPSNIMVNREGQSILTDFGLVMLPAQASQVTLGSTFGTPHYVAPEQAISSAAAVPASDIYSLGIILYELSTGQVPFDDESPLSVALKHVSDMPPPPASINPNISGELEDVILKALAKDFADRFATATEMALAVEAALGIGSRTGTEPLAAPVLPAGVPPAEEVAAMTLPNASAAVPGAGAEPPPTEPSAAPVLAKNGAPVWVWPVLAVVLLAVFGFFFFGNFGSSVQATPTTGAAVAVVEDPPDTPTPTETPSPQPTATSTATDTPLPPTDTPQPTGTPTPLPTETPTSTPTATFTHTPTPVPTDTPTPTSTPTETPVPLPTFTPTPEGLAGKILFKTDRAGFVQIYQMNADGSNQRPMEDFSTYSEYEARLPFSPDGENQVVVRGEGQFDLWWANLVTGQELRVTSTGKPEYDPAWSPVDSRITYVSEETGNGDIYVLNLGGSAVTRMTDNIDNFDKHPTWAPDGTKIAYWSDIGFSKNRQIWVVDIATQEIASLSDNPFNDWDPIWIWE